MARHRSFSSKFKRQIAKEFLDGQAGLHELARRHSLSRNLIRLWIHKYEAVEFTDELPEAVHIAEYERKIAELERKAGRLTIHSRRGRLRLLAVILDAWSRRVIGYAFGWQIVFSPPPAVGRGNSKSSAPAS